MFFSPLSNNFKVTNYICKTRDDYISNVILNSAVVAASLTQEGICLQS